MNLRNKKILVTGADGFIGSHLTEELLRSGCNVRAFVLYNSFNSWGWLDEAPKSLQDNLEIFSGDIRDPHGVYEAVKGCDIVLHLAALVAIPYSYHSPDTYIDTNIKGTLNILQAARKLEVAKVVHTSTSEVYGTARFTPINEDHPLQGQSPYAATKIAADQMAMAFYNSFDTPVAIIRPFNTYGPRQSARAVIPTVITQIAGGQHKIKLGSTHPTRDFNYIKDTVKGFISVAEAAATVGKVINIGSNYEISIGELVELIAEVMQVRIEIQTEEERLRPEKSEVERLWADNTRAEKLLGWKPEYAGYEGLKRGLAETIKWFSQSGNLKKYRPEVYNL
ncbi:NAD-dependent 4,6-dehydratase LegB [Phosphitispora fastidiosa]|uniref:NAD-dependent 4,6-dehydratase LegB n=1 Tax=Phosphitispora fastidiosa TaxID=2837202 RepID=UPI001E2AF7A5|nr:NAD-dependent 4,6-dehydratase LegB [Phosphitispora fastidiosa]MBU7008486.1 dTDP-glucose 4 [Phosphitispora fastidiosa]